MTGLIGKARATWRRLRAWRRISFTTGGTLFCAGALAVGAAAATTGNNLLYLLLGAMLGLIALSGWLSERTLRGLVIERRLPRAVTVGKPVRIAYQVHNHKRRFPTVTVQLFEPGLSHGAFISRLDAGESVTVRSENVFVRRGVHHLEALTLSTTFPFGLFRKERDVPLAGDLVIWPRTNQPVHIPYPPGGRRQAQVETALASAAGTRGEYRGLREYRVGDDPRDIHWRLSAHKGEPVVREYEQDAAEALWICLETRGTPGERAEAAVETAASLAGKAYHSGKRFGLSTPYGIVEAGAGSGQLERVLDALAGVDFSPDERRVQPPDDPARCVLVSLTGGQRDGFVECLEPGPWTEPLGGLGGFSDMEPRL
jgi:uncharacterized protein (DUF58 family)